MLLGKACIIIFVAALSVKGYRVNIQDGNIYGGPMVNIQDGNIYGGPRVNIQDGNIYGGPKVKIRNVQFMASIRFHSYLLCSGTIIHHQFILTTANCVPEQPSYYTVYVGANEYTTSGNKYKVATIIRNENFAYYDYDIALLKLTAKIVFSALVNKIDIATDDLKLYTDTKLEVIGWGQPEKIEISKDLQKVTVSVVSQSECRSKYNFLTPRMFCAEGNGKGFCSRDEGAPAILDGVQVGVILDYKLFCTDPPQVYTFLPPLRKWIYDSIELNS